MNSNLLFNPFLKIAGVKSLLIGIFVLLSASALAGLASVRFDGVIDVHFYKSENFLIPFYDNFINWGTTVIIFYLISLFTAGSSVRFIDIAGTFAMARMALIPLCLIMLLPFKKGHIPADFNHIFDWIFMNLVMFFVFIFLIWEVVLMYNAWVTSSNIKKMKANITFIIGILFSEMISKTIIVFFVK